MCVHLNFVSSIPLINLHICLLFSCILSLLMYYVPL